MPALLIARRVEILESQMDALSQLPARMSAVQGAVVALRADMSAEFAAVRDEIRAGDEETRRQMRVLHEDVIARIALLQEGLDRRKGQGPAPVRRKGVPRRR